LNYLLVLFLDTHHENPCVHDATLYAWQTGIWGRVLNTDTPVGFQLVHNLAVPWVRY